jgi:hypothetical protein
MMNSAMFEAFKWIGVFTAFTAAVSWFWSSLARFPKDLSDLTWTVDAPSSFRSVKETGEAQCSRRSLRGHFGALPAHCAF